MNTLAISMGAATVLNRISPEYEEISGVPAGTNGERERGKNTFSPVFFSCLFRLGKQKGEREQK